MPPKRAEGGVAKAGTRTSRKKKVPERDPRQPDIAAGLKSQKRQQDRRETTADVLPNDRWDRHMVKEYKRYTQDLKREQEAKDRSDSDDSAEVIQTRSRARVNRSDEASASEEDAAEDPGPRVRGRAATATLEDSAVQYLATCCSKLRDGPLHLRDQRNLVDMIRHCSVHGFPYLCAMAKETLEGMLTAYPPVARGTNPSGTPLVLTARDVWHPLNFTSDADTTRSLWEGRDRDGDRETQNTVQAFHQLTGAVATALALCEGQDEEDLSDDQFQDLLYAQLCAGVLAEDVRVRVAVFREMALREGSAAALEPHYRSSMVWRMLEAAHGPGELGRAFGDALESVDARRGFFPMIVRLVGAAAARSTGLSEEEDATGRGAAASSESLDERIEFLGGYEGLLRFGQTLLRCVVAIASELEDTGTLAGSIRLRANHRALIDNALLMVSDPSFPWGYGSRAAVMDALPARDLVRFVGLTIACRRIERVDAKAPKYHELTKANECLHSGGGCGVISFYSLLPAVEEVLQYCCDEWGSAGGPTKLGCITQCTEGADLALGMVLRMILACVDRAAEEPDSLEARLLHVWKAPLEALVDKAAPDCSSAMAKAARAALAELQAAAEQ